MADEHDELVDVYNAVALGDQEQIVRMAQYDRHNEARIDALEQRIQDQAGQSATQRELQALQGQKAYLKKVLEWARNNPDVAYDDEAYVHAVQVDTNLAKAYPHMTEEQRLNFAAEITREELGEALERDYGHAIRSMRAHRQGGEVEAKPSRGEGSPEDRIERAIDKDRSSIVAQMKKEREELRTTTAKAYSGPLKEDYRRTGER
ncbi:MAG TPA: hypothetical protein VGO37_06075 [Steroidobacteraceae bacterium]|jgi:hypothetical protein|nr:hypothetical protein [Steroidobacteraceae bacterium]